MSELPARRERLAQLGEVVVAWERLRVWYNAVLACAGLFSVLLILPRMLFDPLMLGELLIAAFAANLCFLAGPLIEGYVTWWRGPAPVLRHVVFIVGTLGAVGLTFAVVLEIAMPLVMFTGAGLD